MTLNIVLDFWYHKWCNIVAVLLPHYWWLFTKNLNILWKHLQSTLKCRHNINIEAFGHKYWDNLFFILYSSYCPALHRPYQLQLSNNNLVMAKIKLVCCCYVLTASRHLYSSRIICGGKGNITLSHQVCFCSSNRVTTSLRRNDLADGITSIPAKSPG